MHLGVRSIIWPLEGLPSFMGVTRNVHYLGLLKAWHGYLGCWGGICITGVGQGVRLNSMDWIRGGNLMISGLLYSLRLPGSRGVRSFEVAAWLWNQARWLEAGGQRPSLTGPRPGALERLHWTGCNLTSWSGNLVSHQGCCQGIVGVPALRLQSLVMCTYELEYYSDQYKVI